MQSLSEIVNQKESSPKKKGGERHALLGEIFEIYQSESERTKRKVENWRRYVAWLKSWRIPDSKESRKKFKRTKGFLKELPISGFARFISHIPTQDLYYVVSMSKDTSNRGFSAIAWLFSKI